MNKGEELKTKSLPFIPRIGETIDMYSLIGDEGADLYFCVTDLWYDIANNDIRVNLSKGEKYFISFKVNHYFEDSNNPIVSNHSDIIEIAKDELDMDEILNKINDNIQEFNSQNSKHIKSSVVMITNMSKL